MTLDNKLNCFKINWMIRYNRSNCWKISSVNSSIKLNDWEINLMNRNSKLKTFKINWMNQICAIKNFKISKRIKIKFKHFKMKFTLFPQNLIKSNELMKRSITITELYFNESRRIRFSTLNKLRILSIKINKKWSKFDRN